MGTPSTPEKETVAFGSENSSCPFAAFCESSHGVHGEHLCHFLPDNQFTILQYQTLFFKNV